VWPAIHLAERFTISPYLAYQINSSKEAIFADKGIYNVFTSKGNLLQVGDICHNLKLAKTLQAIAKFGPKVFYNGIVGAHLVKDVQREGGILTLRDLISSRSLQIM
jgi:gamma-glutamyltranspeptidase/glutathione hydrolase/leukotriene-C4 hydrolase